MDNENLCQEIEHYTSNCNNQRNEQMPKPTDSWSKDCPMSILERIFLELKPQDLCACAQVCWYWNEVSSQNSIWKPHLERDRPKWKSLTNEKSRELLSRFVVCNSEAQTPGSTHRLILHEWTLLSMSFLTRQFDLLSTSVPVLSSLYSCLEVKISPMKTTFANIHI